MHALARSLQIIKSLSIPPIANTGEACVFKIPSFLSDKEIYNKHNKKDTLI